MLKYKIEKTSIRKRQKKHKLIGLINQTRDLIYETEITS
jgi:hypothetical protein